MFISHFSFIFIRIFQIYYQENSYDFLHYENFYTVLITSLLLGVIPLKETIFKGEILPGKLIPIGKFIYFTDMARKVLQ